MWYVMHLLKRENPLMYEEKLLMIKIAWMGYKRMGLINEWINNKDQAVDEELRELIRQAQ